MSIKIKGKNLHLLFKKENEIIKLRKYYNQLNILKPNDLKILEKTTSSKINSLSLEKKDIEFLLIDSNNKTNIENLTSNKNILGNKTSFSNNENILNQKIKKNNNNNKIIHKSKSDSNIIKHNKIPSNRFDNYNDYLIKFLPGPGQYNLNKKGELFGKNLNHNFLYNSLFKSYVKPEKVNKTKEKLGPGYYEPLILNKNNNNIILNTKEKRFLKSKSDLIGPGKYFDNILVNYNSFKWNEKNKSPQFILNNGKYNDISDKLKEEYVLSKYINLGNEKNDEQNINKNYSNFLKIKKEFLNYIVYPQKNIKKIVIKKIYNDDILFKKKENDEIQNKINNYKLNILKKYEKNKDKNYYKGISSFISKSKRISIYDQIEKRHYPGPCYYQRIEKKNKKLSDYFKFDIKEYFKKKREEYEKNKSKN